MGLTSSVAADGNDWFRNNELDDDDTYCETTDIAMNSWGPSALRNLTQGKVQRIISPELRAEEMRLLKQGYADEM